MARQTQLLPDTTDEFSEADWRRITAACKTRREPRDIPEHAREVVVDTRRLLTRYGSSVVSIGPRTEQLTLQDNNVLALTDIADERTVATLVLRNAPVPIQDNLPYATRLAAASYACDYLETSDISSVVRVESVSVCDVPFIGEEKWGREQRYRDDIPGYTITGDLLFGKRRLAFGPFGFDEFEGSHFEKRNMFSSIEGSEATWDIRRALLTVMQDVLRTAVPMTTGETHAAFHCRCAYCARGRTNTQPFNVSHIPGPAMDELPRRRSYRVAAHTGIDGDIIPPLTFD